MKFFEKIDHMLRAYQYRRRRNSCGCKNNRDLDIDDFLDEIDSPYIGSYFDVGNVVFSGYPEQWIRILGKHIKKVHFKDYRCNPGGLDCFVDLLSGDVNWPEVMLALKEINYDDWVTAEMIPPYTHAADQIIYNTTLSMDRIINQEF